MQRVSAEQVRTLLLPRLKPGSTDNAERLAEGEGACPGVASGVVVTDPDEAERRAAAGEAVVLYRATTSPDDIHGMIAAKAIVTEQGGSTSHAAVVSRALGRPCVVGIGKQSDKVRPGDIVTVDGEKGVVYAGSLDVEWPDEAADPRLARLIEWARAESGVEVITPDSGDFAGAVDVDQAMASGELNSLADVLAGAAAARGAMLSDPANARIAAAQGVKWSTPATGSRSSNCSARPRMSSPNKQARSPPTPRRRVHWSNMASRYWS